MSIRIVTHCWSGRHHQYSTFLRAQLSSLVIYKPSTRICMTVCCSTDDKRVTDVLQDFSSQVTLEVIPLTLGELGRRSIGRNKAALNSYEDLVWFCDCDYLFGDGCLDDLYSTWFDAECPDLVWPTSYLTNIDKQEIDDLVQNNKNSIGMVFPNIGEYVEKETTRAIGGLQIVSGGFARKHGYLKGTKWQIPTAVPFDTTRDDVQFRRYLEKHGTSKPIKFQNLIRMRHTEVGYGPHACVAQE